jgi:pimeloyl-ACP methyl ester carboxylesterase
MIGGEGTQSRLLIHGGLADGSVWAPLAGLLDGRIVIADRPGHGLSFRVDYRKVGDFRAAAAEWVRDVTNGLGEDRIDVVGNSMGGFFAIAFAAAHPERVRRLALLGYPAGLSKETPLWFRLWGSPIAGPVIGRMKIKDVDHYRKAVLPPNVAVPDRVSREQSEVEFLAGNLPNFDLTAQTMFRAVTTLRGWKTDQLLNGALLALETPTLFMWGDKDAIAPPELGISFAEKMVSGRLEVVPDAGHMPWMDQPEYVAQVLNDFL